MDGGKIKKMQAYEYCYFSLSTFIAMRSARKRAQGRMILNIGEMRKRNPDFTTLTSIANAYHDVEEAMLFLHTLVGKGHLPVIRNTFCTVRLSLAFQMLQRHERLPKGVTNAVQFIDRIRDGQDGLPEG